MSTLNNSVGHSGGAITKFSDEHWFQLLDGQEGQSVVDDIMQYVIESAQQSLLERHVERRLISYTVAAGRGALDFLINVRSSFIFFFLSFFFLKCLSVS